jgi:hypothetical protein
MDDKICSEGHTKYTRICCVLSHGSVRVQKIDLVHLLCGNT